MYGKTHKIRRAVSAFAAVASVALIALPAAQAGNTAVDDYFRDAQPQNTLVDDWFRDAQPQNTLVDDYFRDATPSSQPGGTVVHDSLLPYTRGGNVVARQGIVAAQNSNGSEMLTDFSGMHWASPLTEAPVVATPQVASNDGFNWGKVGIGIAGAVCGLLLLVALGIGARQIRHGEHRLGRA